MSESMQSVVWRAAPLSQFFTEIFRHKILLGGKEFAVKGGGEQVFLRSYCLPCCLVVQKFLKLLLFQSIYMYYMLASLLTLASLHFPGVPNVASVP